MRVEWIVVTELPADDVYPELWEVAWCWEKLGEHKHVHHSKRAAQRHVGNMLKNLRPDQDKDQVLTVRRLS